MVTGKNAYPTMRVSSAAIPRACGRRSVIENKPASPERLLGRFIEDVGSDAVKVNYDPANMLRYDPVEGVTLLREYIVHTHAKDRDPETKTPTVGKGAVPWKAYIDDLKGIGYEGWYALEDESGQDVFNSLKTGREFLSRF